MTLNEIKEMQEAFSAFKASNDAAQAQFKKFGSKHGELEERLKRSEQALEEIEAKVNRRTNGVVTASRQTEAKQLLMSALRGKADHEAMQRKGLISGDDTAGGYLAPPEYVQEIISNIVEFSPIRSIARVRSTSRSSIMIPKRTGTASASWVAETGSRTETTNPAFGMFELKSHEAYAMTKVSRQELEDSAFDLESFLRSEFGEQFGVLEGAAFVSGNTVGKPEGLLTNSSITSVNSGHASAITADGLISLFYEPKSAYTQRGYWILNRSTLREVRKLKDGTGNYLWSAAGIGASTLVAGSPATILGRPYVECVDMPDISANAYPVIFGDISAAYMVLDRIQVEMLADPITSKATGFVEFSARKRVGGAVMLAEAVKKLKVAA